MYHCKECNLAVIVFEDEVIKACDCDAPIVGDMRANLEGIGGLRQR